MTAAHEGARTGATALDVTLEDMHGHGYGPADVESVGGRDKSRAACWSRFAEQAARLPAVTHGMPKLFMEGLDPGLCIRFRDGALMVLEADREGGCLLQWWRMIPAARGVSHSRRGGAGHRRPAMAIIGIRDRMAAAMWASDEKARTGSEPEGDALSQGWEALGAEGRHSYVRHAWAAYQQLLDAGIVGR